MSMLTRLTLFFVAISVPIALVSAEDRFYLVRDGHPEVTIVHGQGDDYAGERLARCLSDTCGAAVEVVAADAASLAGDQSIVLIGSPESNPMLAKIGSLVGLAIDPDALTDQGYLAKNFNHDGRDWLMLAGGGRDGTIHAVADLIQWRLKHTEKDAWLESIDTCQIPRYRYRWLWTWDTRMDWAPPENFASAVGGAYKRPPEAFLNDYKRCVDFMADHKFNGLVIWGFLRDSHGGVEASQELCEYASRRGVRILPGVGTSEYGGYYYRGKNIYNSDTWLAKHPELRAIGKDNRPYARRLCPSNKENQEWLDRGAKWLFDTFKIGGVNLENGDFVVCYCDQCKKTRAAIPSDEPDYYKDMAITHMVTLKTMRRVAPDAWLSYATYTGWTKEMVENPPLFLSLIPEYAICQWTLTQMARPKHWPKGIQGAAKHNIGYLHWCSRRVLTEHDWYLSEIKEICRNAADAEFEGLYPYGELSDRMPNVELFYLAWEAFLWDPTMTVEQFADERLAHLYGGPKATRTLLQIIPLVANKRQRQESENLRKARSLAEQGLSEASPSGHARWERVISMLDQYDQIALEEREAQKKTKK